MEFLTGSIIFAVGYILLRWRRGSLLLPKIIRPTAIELPLVPPIVWCAGWGAIIYGVYYLGGTGLVLFPLGYVVLALLIRKPFFVKEQMSLAEKCYHKVLDKAQTEWDVGQPPVNQRDVFRDTAKLFGKKSQWPKIKIDTLIDDYINNDNLPLITVPKDIVILLTIHSVYEEKMESVLEFLESIDGSKYERSKFIKKYDGEGDVATQKPSREQKRLKKIFTKHYQQAQGSDFQKSLIAAVMASLEVDLVKAECNRRAESERLIFLITYECFILWIIKSALESILSERKTQSMIDAAKNYIAAHGPYESEPFERIWNSILLFMPRALVPGQNGLIFPVAEMMVSAHFAGYPIDQNCSPLFATHVMTVIPQLSEMVKTQLLAEGAQSEAHKEANKSSKQETTTKPIQVSQPEIKLENRIKCHKCEEQLFEGIIYCPNCSSRIPTQRT